MKFVVDIPGKPVPQGSKRHVGNGVLVESNAKALYSWREMAVTRIQQALPFSWVLSSELPMTIDVVFFFSRPKGHYGTGRNASKVRRSAPGFMTSRPDLDKLVRAVLDACTIAGVYRDDSQVIQIAAEKCYTADSPSTRLIVTEENR